MKRTADGHYIIPEGSTALVDFLLIAAVLVAFGICTWSVFQ